MLDGEEIFSLGSANCEIFFTPDSKSTVIYVRQHERHGFVIDGRAQGEFDLIHSKPIFCNGEIMLLAERDGEMLRCTYQLRHQ